MSSGETTASTGWPYFSILRSGNCNLKPYRWKPRPNYTQVLTQASLVIHYEAIMRVYKYLPRHYALDALTKRRIKISEIGFVNDPFELSPHAFEPEVEVAYSKFKAELAAKHGMMCFCATTSGPVIWAHYAENHRGMCLGFDIPDTAPNVPTSSDGSNAYLRPVSYQKDKLPFPNSMDGVNQDLMLQILFTKYRHWSYEKEYRLFVTLDTKIDGMYFSDFGEHLVLKEIILGYLNTDSKRLVRCHLDPEFNDEVDIWKVKPSPTEYKLVRDQAFDLQATSPKPCP